jgi:hypothetical protein
MTVELEPGSAGACLFKIEGDELEGAAIEGQARPDGGAWKLGVEDLKWFGNWTEGWTEAAFSMEGELSLEPDGGAWKLVVLAEPKIEEPTSASMRLYGDYFEGDKALALFRHRWDRIQAVNEALKAKFTDAWFDYSEPRKVTYAWDIFGRTHASFQKSVKAFLFPELYGYPRGSSKGQGKDLVFAESIEWDSAYTKATFPERLWEVRDSGTMLRDFEECVGLWRLDFCWEELWMSRAQSVDLVKLK